MSTGWQAIGDQMLISCQYRSPVSLDIPIPDPSDPRYTKRGALYVPSGQGPTIWAASGVYTVKAAATQTGGLFGFLDASVPPGGGPEAHAHNHQAETFYLLSGELEFLDGDRTQAISTLTLRDVHKKDGEDE